MVVAADSKAKFLQDAERYVLQGKVQQAIGEYLKIVKCDPKDVLILNTVGDLYLRQGDTDEANKCFSQVAEEYVHNNFFLKAIAVYKKILDGDPRNLEISSIVASLYAKQGLNIDARNQYLRVASLLEKEGKSKELLEAYEKIVELDSSNSNIQRKLAELHLAQGNKEKAHLYWTKAAQAQANAGEFSGALDSFGRAMQLNPLDLEAMKGFLDCSLKTGNAAPIIERLKQSLEIAPENIDMREMLGRAYLAHGDPDLAAGVFQVVVSMDESRYEDFFAVCQYFIDKAEYDKAAASLDPIIPTLISRRQTDRAAKLYESILQRSPMHLPSMLKLESIYSAIDDQLRHIATLDKIVDYYVSQKKLVEALENLERILRSSPESEKHHTLHRRLFSEVHPNAPYVPPAEPQESRPRPIAVSVQQASPDAGESSTSEMVEVDLLLNYGMTDKALSILRSMETRDPANKELRIRLVSILRDQKKYSEAAEQYLILAALYRRVNNEDLARKSLSEAKQLDPELVAREPDPESFARRSGVSTSAPVEAGGGEIKLDTEFDLSEDLMEILSKGEKETAQVEFSEPQALEGASEEFPQEISAPIPSKPVQEQYQEVDFYIRLGFMDEARAKLDEIAKLQPNDPELISRYKQLQPNEVPAARDSASSGPAEKNESEMTFSSAEASREPEAENAPGFFAGFADEKPPKPVDQKAVTAPAGSVEAHAAPGLNAQLQMGRDADKPDLQGNAMFADVLEEFSSESQQESDKDSFENHFSLGTAYSEMDLIEEAIKEFQAAMKTLDPKRDSKQLIQCCGMLSTCFLKKGMPRSALRWCQAGLSVLDISSHEAMALRYDMGVAHSMEGRSERALECFDQVFGTDPSYRDVAQRIDELKGGSERHAP
jgi:tetratricopeptide (TPR) repeat protein